MLSVSDKVIAESTFSVSDKVTTAVISIRTRIRREPGGEAYRFLEPGEQVSVVSENGAWLKVGSKWVLASSGKPMVGYILRSAAKLPQKNVFNVKQESSGDNKLIMNQLAEIERLRAELAAREKRQKELESEIVSIKATLGACQGSLRFTEAKLEKVMQLDQSKLLSLADSGEMVFVNGVGEGSIAVSGERTVLRFPLSSSKKSDSFFSKGAEKHTLADYVYYVVPSKMLQEQFAP